MLSSIALGCGGYEAYMQQILTPYGVLANTGDHNFCLQKPSESSKTERKTQNPSQFSRVFLEVHGGLPRDNEILQVLIETSQHAKEPGNAPFPGSFFTQNFMFCFREF